MIQRSHKFLRKTKGVCMTCLEAVPADFVLDEERDVVLLEKHCERDGESADDVTGSGRLFAELDAFYHRIMKRMRQQVYFAEIHSTCNLSCKFCYVKDKVEGAMPDFDIDDLPEEVVRGNVINLIGAEPTLSPSLIEKIESIRDKGGVPQLSTNGILCKNPAFVQKLVQAGVDRLFLQFDSLSDDYYRDVCGIPLVEQKKRALRNLDEAGLLTTLRMVVIRGSNDREIWDLIEFLQDYPSAISIHLMGLSKIGMALENYDGEAMMPLDIARVFCEQSRGQVEMRDILVFLKAFYTWTAIEEVKWCMHIYPFLMLKDGDRYLTYTAIFDRDRMDRGLEALNASFDRTHRRRNWLRYLRVMIGALKPAAALEHGWRHRGILWTLLRKGRREAAKRFTEVNFFTICSPEIIDFNIINNCNAGLITKHESLPLVMENVAHSVYLREKFYAKEGDSFGPTHLAGARDQVQQAVS